MNTSKRLVTQISPHVQLFRDTSTGIAWVEDGTSGQGHSAHPNIDITGSVKGMKQLGYWHPNDRVVESHGFHYNITKIVLDSEFDRIAQHACLCDVCAEHKARKERQA